MLFHYAEHWQPHNGTTQGAGFYTALVAPFRILHIVAAVNAQALDYLNQLPRCGAGEAMRALSNKAMSDRTNRFAWIVGLGFFATNLSLPDLLDLPIRNLLKDDLHLSVVEMATFFALAGSPWYCKAAAGLLSDSVPLFGTRRRHYLFLSSTAAGLLWLLAGAMPPTYARLLLTLLGVNLAIVVASTVLGGFLTEAEQSLGNSGRLVAIRNFAENTCLLIAGPLAGFLAIIPFGITAVTAATAALSIVPVSLAWLHEAPAPTRVTYDHVAAHLKTLAYSRITWWTGSFLFVAAIPQELGTPLFYYLRDGLSIPVATIGWVRSASGIGGILAAALFYRLVAGRYGLRTVVALGIACGALGMFLCVLYRSLPAAVVVEFGRGFLSSVTVQSMLQLAIRATPRSCAATGFALLAGAFNAGSALGDILAADLVDRFSMTIFTIGSLYSGILGLILILVLRAPRTLFQSLEQG